jgi:hypothetical protein
MNGAAIPLLLHIPSWRAAELIKIKDDFDRLCGLAVRVPGYIMEMYCASCEVPTEFIYVM